ncbi:MAG: hypothetical protein EU547_05425 [Promethearchaeota archaeon]|nr:MAG: hypothetical protein EU547_05425 [Candidatus Lokiarchaeota archaeon]
MGKKPNFSVLMEMNIYDNKIRLNEIFQVILNDLISYLNLELVNKKFKILIIDEIRNIDLDTRLFNNGINTYIEKGVFQIELFQYYKKFFPYFLLKSAYKMFVLDNLKNQIIIDFALNQIVSFDLRGFESNIEWIKFTEDKSKIKDQSEQSRFNQYIKLKVREPSKTPIIFFFKFIRRNENLIFENDLQMFVYDLFDKFKLYSSKNFLNDEITETLRILIKIFYNVENIDTLKEYYEYFSKFKAQNLINTDLTFRSFRKNLRWTDKFGYIAPTYYVDWKTLDQLILVCHLKFNPLLEKELVDKVIKKMPFLIAPKLSTTNFAIDLSAYFILPRNYIKDFINFLEIIERKGYIINKELYEAKSYYFKVNLNYLKESYQVEEIINPKHMNYTKNYEIEFNKIFSKEFKNYKISLIDFLILESIRFVSYKGNNFSRIKLLNKIKSDLTIFLSKEYKNIEELENLLKILIYSPNLINEFLKYLKKFEKKGFFAIRNELEILLNYFKIIEKSNELAKINTFTEFAEFVEQKNAVQIINENGAIDTKELITNYEMIFRNYFENRENFKKQVERYRFFHKILDLCSNLKIFNINSIKRIFSEPALLKKISYEKKTRLHNIKNNANQNMISNKYINQRIDYFLKLSPKIIKPYVLNSIWINWSYSPEIILRNTSDVKNILINISTYFHRVYFYEICDLYDKQDCIIAQFHLSYLNSHEKMILTSLLFKLFKDNIISFKRYAWDGLLHNFSTREFYDFNNKEFFYTNDLFDQYILYVTNILGEKLPKSNSMIGSNTTMWLEDKSIKNLLYRVNKRVKSETKNIQKKDLKKLTEFNLNMENYLLNKEEYNKIRKLNFFKKYVKSIKLIPSLNKFGLSQYFLYITPRDFNNIDFRLLLTNTFQKIKHHSYIDSSNSILISYIFPFEDPNTSYLNWLRGQNQIQEYCLFNVHSLSHLFNFDRKLGLNNSELDINSFKYYVKEVISNTDFKNKDIIIKNFDFDNSKISDYKNPHSPYFKSLLNAYNRNSIDIKKKLQLLNESSFEEVRFLIENKIAYPYISLKNIIFKEIVYILLINIKENTNDTLKTIFQYFNLVFIYEITGEYYIHGFDNKKPINKGLMIKLYLQDYRLAEFLRIFEYVFQFLKVGRYLILTDLVNGDHFVKNVFGAKKIFETYNPLNNLIWDPKRKKWKNHKLFGPKFEYLYPDLDYHQEEDVSSTLE